MVLDETEAGVEGDGAGEVGDGEVEEGGVLKGGGGRHFDGVKGGWCWL